MRELVFVSGNLATAAAAAACGRPCARAPLGSRECGKLRIVAAKCGEAESRRGARLDTVLYLLMSSRPSPPSLFLYHHHSAPPCQSSFPFSLVSHIPFPSLPPSLYRRHAAYTQRWQGVRPGLRLRLRLRLPRDLRRQRSTSLLRGFEVDAANLEGERLAMPATRLPKSQRQRKSSRRKCMLLSPPRTARLPMHRLTAMWLDPFPPQRARHV